MNKQIFWEDIDSLGVTQKVLQKNGIILATTDTVLGLLAPLTRVGYEKLNLIKKRQNKPYLLLIAGIERLSFFIDEDSLLQIENIGKIVWPGPITLIAKARADLPNFVKSEDGTIALRVPEDKELRILLDHFEGLFSTSANKTGESIPHLLEQVHNDILHHVNLIIINQKMRKQNNIPSSILDCSQKELVLLREGVITRTILEKKLHKKIRDPK